MLFLTGTTVTPTLSRWLFCHPDLALGCPSSRPGSTTSPRKTVYLLKGVDGRPPDLKQTWFYYALNDDVRPAPRDVITARRRRLQDIWVVVEDCHLQ